MALLAGAGLTKEAVNYRHHEQCSTCTYFYHASGSCRIIDGNISPDAVCDKWQMQDKKGPKDKQYFKKEYEKVMASEKSEGEA